MTWRNVLIAQVVKRYERRRVVDTERRILDGTPARVETLRRRSHGDGVINTAYMERLNATFRERLAPLARRSRALARHTLTLQHGMYLIGTVYNFCTPHASLDLARLGAGMRCVQRVVGVSRAAAALDAPQAARAAIACIATPDGALVLMTTVKCRATSPWRGVANQLTSDTPPAPRKERHDA